MSSRLAVGSVVAVAAHAAALSALHLSVREPGRPADIELDVVVEPAAEQIVATAPRESPVPVVTPRGREGHAAHGTPAGNVAAEGSVAEPGSEAADPVAFSPFGTHVDLGLGRAIMPGGDGAPPASTAPADEPRPRMGRGAESVLDTRPDRDRDLGLGPEGPVLAALNTATHASRAPLRGSATFDATIDDDGHVTDLHIVDGADEGWDDARERAIAILADKIANLRGHHGIIVRVLVSSRLVEPPKSLLGKAGAILFLEPGELARKQQRSVHVRLLGVR